MTRKLPGKDVAIVGLGWTGSILAQELTADGLHVFTEEARGIATAGKPTGLGVPRFAWKLNDAEIAAALTNVGNSWGVAAPAVTGEQVKSERAAVLGSASL